MKLHSPLLGDLVNMDKWSEEDRIRVIELFIEIRSIIATQRAFRRQCHRRHVPERSRPTIGRWVAKQRQYGSVCDNNPLGNPKMSEHPETLIVYKHQSKEAHTDHYAENSAHLRKVIFKKLWLCIQQVNHKDRLISIGDKYFIIIDYRNVR